MKEKLVPLKDHRFECQMCGECCRNRWVPLTLGDVLRLGEIRPIEEFLLIWNGKKLVIDRRKWDNGCIFLEDNRCEIHGIKPLICRLYPIALSEFPILEENIPYYLKNGKKVYLYIDENCKGVGKGKKIDIEKLLKLCETVLQEIKETSMEKLMDIV